MSALKFNLLLLTVGGISLGQILFKYAANNIGKKMLVLDASFLIPAMSAITIYGLSTLGWIYLLRDTELNKAYPVFALSFVIVPLLGVIVFGEPLSKYYIVGILFIFTGVVLVTR